MTSITSAAFRVGDTVEIIAEDMEYEGKIGKVVSIDAETDTLRVNFEGHGSVWFDPHELCRLKDRDDDTCDECGAPTSPQQNNLCEKCRMREADTAAAEAAFWEASTAADPELTATATEINRLQSIIDEQRQQLIRANTRAEAAEAARDDYEERLDSITEKYKAAQILLEGIVAPKRKEVFPFRDITAIELQTRINDGWEILHMQFMANSSGEDRLNVVLTRECPAPQPTAVEYDHGYTPSNLMWPPVINTRSFIPVHSGGG